MPTINLGLIAENLSPAAGDALERTAYGVMVSERPAPADVPSALEAPSDDPGPHLSYAIQWILFAVMGFVFIGYVIRTELRHRREDADATEDTEDTDATEDSPGTSPLAPASRRRRRARAADDDDALLDAAGR